MKLSIWIFLVCVLIGCKPEPIETIIPQTPSKLVITSQVMPDGILAVVVSRTFSALEQVKPVIGADSTLQIPRELLVEGAEVKLITPSGEVELEELSAGVYVATNWNMVSEFEYTIRVNDSRGGQQVIATTPLLPTSKLDMAELVEQGGRKSIRYRFTDDPTRPNWYVVNFLARATQRDSILKNTDPNLIARRMMEQRLDFDLISEADMVNGQFVGQKSYNVRYADTIGVMLSNISREYFEFLKQYKQSVKLINQLKGEVVNLPTNIQNGYGYFSLNCPDLKVLNRAK